MRRLLLESVALVMAFAGVVWAHGRPSARLHVDYYYIPYCMSCARVLHSLDSFKGQFGARVEVRTVDCFSPEGVVATRKYGFVTHGIVVENADRQLLFEEKDHGVSADDVRVIVQRELTKR